MQFENAFEVTGQIDEVIATFADLPLLASFLPGAHVGARLDDGAYPGELIVAFGPKRLTFRGILSNDLHADKREGLLKGQARGDIRGAQMAVSMRYSFTSLGDRTSVLLLSEAELTGILADFARTGGAILTRALLTSFAGNLENHLRQTKSATSPSATEVQQIGPTTGLKPKPLSALSLLWQIFRHRFFNRAKP